MEALQRNSRTLLVIHLAATLFMVGLIWTIHYVHYPLFAYVGESTYASFQAAHGITLIGVLALAFLGTHKVLRVPAVINGAAMAVVLVISGFWSAPAHAKLADGFDTSIHDQLMTVNLIRTLAWTVCGICAIWMVLSDSLSTR
ncbi:hypothetical protein GM51_19695 [freshwater metagenome]|uniref:DUF4149 domain-containing protein n=1 Tax=freshwater metagenome TaxID=449393 RepID=A0A094PUW4_9ZZZZ